jgi:uncharacterized protein YecT (DUF1311 family)
MIGTINHEAPMRALPLLIGTFLLCFTATTSAHAEDPIDCSNASTTVEMNFCADKDFAAADENLNAIYKKVLAQIDDSGLEKPYDRASWEEAMRASQRAWVAYRDADCKGLVPMEWSGGSGTSAAVLGCMSQKTIERTKELSERYLQN